MKKEIVGIILSGGKGSRLYPSTSSISKQLLPIYDKPLVYYPLSVLMLADIRKILVICADDQLDLFQNLIGDGSQWGLDITYKIQEEPKGIADAFIVGKEFINDRNVCLVLGDNILWGQGLTGNLLKAKKGLKGGRVFSYPVSNPEEFGVLTLNRKGQIIDIEEKPKLPKSNLAVPGIYFFDSTVVNVASKVKPSKRGEVEIVDVIRFYLRKKMLDHFPLGRGFAWLDTGSPEFMLEASNFVQAIEKRQGTKIACLEEIAYTKGWISRSKLSKLIQSMPDSSYKRYLLKSI